MMGRALFSVLSPQGPQARLSVLIFHRILPKPDPLLTGEPDAREFDEILGWMKSWFNVLPLDDAVVRLREGRLPSRAAAITFDDGYQDNYTVALPALKRHGLSATFFISTGFLDGGRMWNDSVVETVRRIDCELNLESLGLGRFLTSSYAEKRQTVQLLLGCIKYLPHEDRLALTRRIAEVAGVSLPLDLMMTSEQVRLMRREGMLIGAHTVSHPILLGCDRGQVSIELRESRDYLQNLLQERVGLFAYPNGKPGVDYGMEDVNLVRQAGFDAAFSTAWAAAKGTDDLHQLPRFTPWDRQRARFGMRMAVNLLQSARKGVSAYTVPKVSSLRKVCR